MRMRQRWLAVAVVSLVVSEACAQLPPTQTGPLGAGQGLQGAAGCSATDASSCAQAAAKITPIVMGDSPLAENLRKLTDVVGGRVSGSPQMAQAVEWGVAAFRAAGIDVHTEKYMMPHGWGDGATRLEMLGGEEFPVWLVSVGLSPTTPEGGIEAPLVFIGEGSEADFAHAGAVVKGAILLVHTEVR